MSFAEYKERISEGDTVILFLGHNSMQTLTVTPGKVHQTKYGALPHSDMIGKKFGTKMFSLNKKGWVYLLHPTPELWTVNLPHRTQILYSTDISMVILQLALKPGSVVVESELNIMRDYPSIRYQENVVDVWGGFIIMTVQGCSLVDILFVPDTGLVSSRQQVELLDFYEEALHRRTGSGSMSHCLIRTIAPSGHLHTFEFHSERAETARKEFEEHKISHLVTVRCRDVCKEGFELHQVADAVFLDLPAPWDAVKHSKEAIKTEGGRICSFSPCIEQVQRTCESLRACGFRDIKVMECLSRTFEVRTVPLQVPFLGPENPHPPGQTSRDFSSRKRKLQEESVSCDVPSSTLQDGHVNMKSVEYLPVENTPSDSKSPTDNAEHKSEISNRIVTEKYALSPSKHITDTDPDSGLVRNVRAVMSQKTNKANILTGRPLKEMTGHTGYLTFATLYAHVTSNNGRADEGK